MFCVEISPRMMRELLPVGQRKKNMVPLLGDANKPGSYAQRVSSIDVIYQDVAQPNQAEILIKNVEVFRPRHAMLAIKARSINTAMNPKKVFKAEIRKLKEKFEVLETINLAPFEKDHVFVNLRVK